jgi:hypothetical protein
VQITSMKPIAMRTESDRLKQRLIGEMQASVTDVPRRARAKMLPHLLFADKDRFHALAFCRHGTNYKRSRD